LPADASVFTRWRSCAPGARRNSTLMNGKRLLNALMTGVSLSATFAE
jgi:hypothetical protein